MHLEFRVPFSQVLHRREDLMAAFTPTQGRYLAYIHAYTDLHGYPPAEAEIAAAMCVSPRSVNQMVKVLERRGLIDRRPGQPRSIRVRTPENEIPPWHNRKHLTISARADKQSSRLTATPPAVPSRLYALVVQWRQS